MRPIAFALCIVIAGCTGGPPAAGPIPTPSAGAATVAPTPATAAVECFGAPPPTYLPWGEVPKPTRLTNDRGVALARYEGPPVGGGPTFFIIGRGTQTQLGPPPTAQLRDVQGRSVEVTHANDPRFGEVIARWQEGMDGCMYVAGLYWPRSLPEPELAKVIASLDVWAAARAQLPAEVAVLKPTYLPARFSEPPWLVSLFNDNSLGPRYYIGYAAQGESLIFYLGSANSAPPTSTETIAVRGVSGTLGTTGSWPAIQVIWLENGHPYVVQGGSAMTRDELLGIVASLVEVR